MKSILPYSQSKPTCNYFSYTQKGICNVGWIWICVICFYRYGTLANGNKQLAVKLAFQTQISWSLFWNLKNKNC